MNYRIRHFFNWLGGIPREIKWFIQRGKRGWADSDVWGVDYYLSRIIPQMLKRLKEIAHGYPGTGDADSPEKWDKLLGEMIEGFEAANRILEDNYLDTVQPGWYEETLKLKDNTKTAIKKESVRKAIKLINADIKLFEKSMGLFKKWYFNLWD